MVPNLTGLRGIRCATFQIAAYCSSPRGTRPTMARTNPDSRQSRTVCPGGARPDDARHPPRFRVVVQDVPGREADRPAARRDPRIEPVEAAHVARRIVGPALAADVAIEMRIAVGDDVEAGDLLLVQIHRDPVGVLLAELVVDERLDEAVRADVLGVPARARQRPGDGGRQLDVLGGTQHSSGLRLYLVFILPCGEGRSPKASGVGRVRVSHPTPDRISLRSMRSDPPPAGEGKG